MAPRLPAPRPRARLAARTVEGAVNDKAGRGRNRAAERCSAPPRGRPGRFSNTRAALRAQVGSACGTQRASARHGTLNQTPPLSPSAPPPLSLSVPLPSLRPWHPTSDTAPSRSASPGTWSRQENQLEGLRTRSYPGAPGNSAHTCMLTYTACKSTHTHRYACTCVHSGTCMRAHAHRQHANAHTHIYACTHAAHKCTHAQISTRLRTCTHAHVCTQTHTRSTQMHAYTQMCIHMAYLHSHTYTCTLTTCKCTHTPVHMHAHMDARTHTHYTDTPAHTHTSMYARTQVLPPKVLTQSSNLQLSLQ